MTLQNYNKCIYHKKKYARARVCVCVDNALKTETPYLLKELKKHVERALFRYFAVFFLFYSEYWRWSKKLKRRSASSIDNVHYLTKSRSTLRRYISVRYIKCTWKDYCHYKRILICRLFLLVDISQKIKYLIFYNLIYFFLIQFYLQILKYSLLRQELSAAKVPALCISR